MIERYPFFRDTDERTRAVIGENAIAADLSGTYQKPYAVLTQKRLYCKNERGNFITEASAVRSAGVGLLPGRNGFIWGVVACAGLMFVEMVFLYFRAPVMPVLMEPPIDIVIVGVKPKLLICLGALAAAFLPLLILTMKQRIKTAVFAGWAAAVIGVIGVIWCGISGDFLLSVFSYILYALSGLIVLLGLLTLWQDRRMTVFQIVHSAGYYAFNHRRYPAGELKAFTKQVKLMQASGADGE